MDGIASKEMVLAGWAMLALYAGAVLYLVVRGARQTKSMADYAVGSIAFSPVAVGLALGAAMMSAATFIINPGLIANYGISGVLSMAVVMPIATLISLVVLTKGFRKHGSTVKATTLAQWIGTRFKSRGYRVMMAFLSLLLITFIVLIAVGLTKVVSKTLNVGELYALIGIVVFIFGYMMFGGANSMVYTNTIQAVLMLVISFVLLGSGYEHFSEGVHGLLDKLAAIDPNLATATNPASPLYRDYFEIVFCQVIIGIAIVCQPHIITKSLFLKSDKDVNRYLTVGVVASGIFFLVVTVGLYARLMFPDLTIDGAPLKSDGIMSAYVVREFPVYLGIVVVMGMIAAGISTLEGLIQSVSTMLTSDLIEPFFGRFYPRDEGRRARFEVTLNRGVIGALGLVSAVIAWDQIVDPDLSVAILAQNGVYAYFAAAFVPVLFGTFLRDVPKLAPIAASATAILVHFAIYYGRLTPYMQEPVRNPGVPGALAVVASVIVGGGILVAYRAGLIRAPDEAAVEPRPAVEP